MNKLELIKTLLSENEDVSFVFNNIKYIIQNVYNLSGVKIGYKLDIQNIVYNTIEELFNNVLIDDETFISAVVRFENITEN